MLKIGTKVIHKKSNQYGIILNKYPKNNYPTGYEIVTDDEIHHICLEEDFIILDK